MTTAETDPGKPEGLVSITEAAEILSAEGDKIDRSALSRYCDAWSLKRGKRGRAVVVDLDEVRRHRADNYQREVMSGRPLEPVAPKSAGGVSPKSPAAVPPAEGAVPSAAAGIPSTAEVVELDPARREKKAKAESAEIALAKEKGLIADAAAVEAGLAEAIIEMRQTFGATAKACAAESLSELGLPADRSRELAAAFRRYARQAEARFVDRVAKLASDPRDEIESVVARRLEILAAKAGELRDADAKAAGAVFL
jgi:hypothetical protein